MNTHEQPTTDRIDGAEPTLTDGRWQAATDDAEPVAAVDAVQRQFAVDVRARLPNLVDDENRAMF
jgi:hypothetical protein